MSVYTPEQLINLAKQQKASRPAGGDYDPAVELSEYIEDVTSGRIYAVALPWRDLDRLTNALMPGAFVVVCGDPGVGKTYFLLDCLRHWTANNVDASIYFLEEDRKFYLRRILAQEEGKSEYTRIAWWKENADATREAAARHADTIRELGARITVAESLKQLALGTLTAWLEEELKNGRRVCVIDPITAAYAGADRWLADDDFVMRTKALVSRYDASLIVVTHPKNLRNATGHRSGHDMANGTAYFRFSSAAIWLNRTRGKKRYNISTAWGPSTVDTDLTIQIHKAREGALNNAEIAFKFGDGLRFTEAGIITGESDESPDDQADEPMSSAELKRVMEKLPKTFPLKTTQAQADVYRREFGRHSLSVVQSAIDAHFAKHGNDPDGLLETLKRLP